PGPPRIEQRHQPVAEPLGVRAAGEAWMLGGQLLTEVAPRDPGDARGMRDAVGVEEGRDALGELISQLEQRGGLLEDRPEAAQRSRAAVQLIPLAGIFEEGPVETGEGPRRGRVAQQPRAVMEREQLAQDDARVDVVNAPLVA